MRRKNAKLCLILTLILAASMLFGCTRKPHYAETSVADKINITDTSAYSLYYDAGMFKINLPEYTFRAKCDKAFFIKDGEYDTKGKHEITFDSEDTMMVGGWNDEYDINVPEECLLVYMLDYEEAEVRIIFMDGDRIAGYALLCFWGAETGVETPYYYSQKIVKAVTFDKVDGEYPDVTEEEVNSLLDDAMQELVIDAKLYETRHYEH